MLTAALHAYEESGDQKMGRDSPSQEWNDSSSHSHALGDTLPTVGLLLSLLVAKLAHCLERQTTRHSL